MTFSTAAIALLSTLVAVSVFAAAVPASVDRPPRAVDAGLELAQAGGAYATVLTDPAQRCPRSAPSRVMQMQQYQVWACRKGASMQYDLYNDAGYSHSLVLPY